MRNAKFLMFSIWVALCLLSPVALALEKVGTQFTANATPFSGEGFPAVAMDGAGHFVATWEEPNLSGLISIVAQRYDGSGAPIGSNFQVDDPVPYANHSRHPAIAMNSSQFVVVWGADQSGVWARIYSSSTGMALGNPINVGYGDVGLDYQAVAVDAAGDFVVTWMNYDAGPGTSSIMARRYTSSGSPLGSEFLVDGPFSGGLYSLPPRIAMGQGGEFGLVWTRPVSPSTNEIYARFYDSSGAATIAAFPVPIGTAQGTGFDTRDVGIARNGSGDTLIVSSVSGAVTGLYGQIYDSSGTPKGRLLPILTTLPLQPAYPGYSHWARAAALPSGGYVVTWYGAVTDSDTWAQVLDDRGNKDGGVVHVNTTVNYADVFPSVATGDQGQTVIVWQDGGGPLNTNGQRFCQGEAVSNLMLSKDNSWMHVTLTWTDTASAQDYVVYEDSISNGGFLTVSGAAPSGLSGLTLDMPTSNRFYLVGGRNTACWGGARQSRLTWHGRDTFWKVVP